MTRFAAGVSAVLFALTMSCMQPAAAELFVIHSSASLDTYLLPLDAPERAVLRFELPAELLGAEIFTATLSFTGRTFGDASAAIQRRDSALGNVEVGTTVLPFNFGSAYAAVDVSAALASWLGASVPRRPNEGLQLVALDSVFSEVVTELHPVTSYWPSLEVSFNRTAASLAAERIDDASGAFGMSWDFDDLASLWSLYEAGTGSTVIDGETWSYTANEYSNGGAWGGPRELGEAWLDEQGYKHIYLGSGLTTAPVPLPTTAWLLGTALLGMATRRRPRNAVA